MSDHNEAMRLADRISPETDWYEFDQVTWCNQAAALLRKQAERIAELERLSTGLSAVYNESMDSLRIVVDERDTLRAEVERLKPNAERYEWLCEKLGETQLPTLIERITRGYVADYKPSIDAAIDTARKATQ